MAGSAIYSKYLLLRGIACLSRYTDTNTLWLKHFQPWPMLSHVSFGKKGARESISTAANVMNVYLGLQQWVSVVKPPVGYSPYLGSCQSQAAHIFFSGGWIVSFFRCVNEMIYVSLKCWLCKIHICCYVKWILVSLSSIGLYWLTFRNKLKWPVPENAI